MHDERALQRTLLDLGVADATLRFRLDGEEERELPQAQFSILVDLLSELDVLTRRVALLGTPFGEYLAARDADGRFPLYRVAHVDGNKQRTEHLFYSEADYDAFVLSLSKELGDDLHIVGEEEEGEQTADEANSLHPCRFDQAARVGVVVSEIEALGLPVASLNGDHEGNGDEEPPFTIVSDGDTVGAPSLLGLIPVVRDLGRVGLDIQRYKGLGEMNAGELAETTLQPEVRHAAQVTIGDVVKADNYFSILAGKDVKRRREFIERYAPEVRNLDV